MTEIRVIFMNGDITTFWPYTYEMAEKDFTMYFTKFIEIIPMQNIKTINIVKE